mmetsp:Transcript_62811/g.161662  ORF Transcript_62811/g.161662 Transcript_62811/m.161662 type:complete len:411 (-) Transcript_62811:55-1287(-)
MDEGSPMGGSPQMTRRRSTSNPPTYSSDSVAGGSAEEDSSLVIYGAKQGGDGGKLPLFHSSYDWIRKANGPADRDLRRGSAEQTMKACRCRGYMLDGQKVLLQHLDVMLQGTCVVRAGVAAAAGASGDNGGSARLKFMKHQPGLLLPVALERTKAGCKAAAVNAASAFNVGGGFFHGGRHALEESICVQSTLFQSLMEAQKQMTVKAATAGSRQGHRGPREKHIPDDGVVISPQVDVFRAGTFEGYAFLPATTTLTAVLSMAAPNCNPRVRDAPVDRPARDEDYLQLLSQKFVALLEACRRSGADTLVVPDIGCGVYLNDAQVMGGVLGATLRTSPATASLREVHLVGPSEFASAVEDTFHQKRPPPQARPADLPPIGTQLSGPPRDTVPHVASGLSPPARADCRTLDSV